MSLKMERAEIRKLVDLAWAIGVVKPQLANYEIWELTIGKSSFTFEQCKAAVAALTPKCGKFPVTPGDVFEYLDAPLREQRRKAREEERRKTLLAHDNTPHDPTAFERHFKNNPLCKRFFT